MPRVEFHVLETAEDQARLHYACRLIEKAFLEDHRVRVRLVGDEEARRLDELLWTFSDRSFVPHEFAAPGATAPVTLAAGDQPGADGQLLVNLGAGLPAGVEGWERIAEIVDADDARRRDGRERFRAYRERGIEPETHRIGAEP